MVSATQTKNGICAGTISFVQVVLGARENLLLQLYYCIVHYCILSLEKYCSRIARLELISLKYMFCKLGLFTQIVGHASYIVRHYLAHRKYYTYTHTL